ncbi:MAG TPA: CDP-alcohol phosphatidyltransferase family protein [Casimicrobiaceae bacterium]|nr:CDP-alcohol phosphatidyltransferase family protein [Casimicrobiaceae bacterium]
MRNVPNVITLLRLALVPAMAYYLADEAYDMALALFLVAALSDLADGYIARRFKLVSTFGATLDPVADKLSMLVATLLLAWQTLLPLWLAIAIVVRDVVIVSGALAYRLVRGRLDVAPTRLSKINTFIEFTVLLLVMAGGAGWIETRPWMPTVFLIVFITVIASGAQYVWVWGRKAAGRRAQ